MPRSTTMPLHDWTTYYTVLRDKLGRDRLRRIRARLYEKLEAINGEIDELEEDKELHFLPSHPEFAERIESEIESLLSAGRAVSVQLETVIALLEESP